MPDNDYAKNSAHTLILRKSGDGEFAVGFVDEAGIIYKLRGEHGLRIGRISPDRRVFRHTRFDERELGSFTDMGLIHSHGLFEGGEVGWVEPDGTVIQAGLIFGEQEVGRVEGADRAAAGAALLLLFVPDEQEESNRANR